MPTHRWSSAINPLSATNSPDGIDVNNRPIPALGDMDKLMEAGDRVEVLLRQGPPVEIHCIPEGSWTFWQRSSARKESSKNS
jgi:hypothetical protein